MSNIFSRKKIA